MIGESSKGLALGIALSLPAILGQSGCPDAPSDFVQVQGAEFTLGGAPYHFVGANSYYLMTFAADPGLRGEVDEVLGDAAAMGLGVVRTWAFNDGPGWNALQTAPGVFDEAVFQGLDYLVYQADNVGVRLTLTLVNNWTDYGGMDQYVAWSPSATAHDDFYTDAYTRQYYKDFLSTLVNRINPLTGRAYRDEPAIFAWELANEPRCPSDPSGATLSAWAGEMSTHLKALDPNHLVTLGAEGFFNDALGPWYLNGSQGVDFVAQHALPGIDFAGAHSYPDHWGLGWDDTFALLDRQLQTSASALRKPFILGEFGKLAQGQARAPGAARRTYDLRTWVDKDGRLLPAPGAYPLGAAAPAEVAAGESRGTWYEAYLARIYDAQAGGSMVWSLAHDGRPDYDGFTLYYPGSGAEVGILTAGAEAMGSL